jgi:hypothetical protein
MMGVTIDGEPTSSFLLFILGGHRYLFPALNFNSPPFGLHRGGAREGWQAPVPVKNFFSNLFLNNIYNFSLSSKAIKILIPFNFIFYFRHWVYTFLYSASQFV